MGKWWAILFAVVNLACLGLFVAAPFVPGWWLPEAVSAHAGEIDNLFYIILWITAFFFVLTEALLVIFIWRYEARPAGQPRPGGNADGLFQFFRKIIPDEHRLELAWTVVPAVILLYIAFVQISAWANIKYESRMPHLDENNLPLPIAVSARQFEWRLRYPGPERWAQWQKWKKEDPKELARDFREFSRADDVSDVHVANELHIWTNKDGKVGSDFPAFLVYLSTLDVQHNFNIPHFRIKQDALPGRVIPVWFRPTRTNTTYNEEKKNWQMDPQHIWEIACAELCGRWHYHMIGHVFVHPSQEDFERWLQDAAEKQGTHKVQP